VSHETITEQETSTAQINLHALMGHIIPQTLRVQGQLKQSPVVILIDSGSTHNFIQDRIAKQLDLPLHQSQAFQVLVGNGEELKCDSIFHEMDLLVGAHHFFVDLFVLPLSGVDIVLGVQWLKILGTVLTDYEQLTMQFMKDGSRVLLQGQPKPNPAVASLHQLKCLVATHVVDTFYHIQLLQPDPLPNTRPNYNPQIHTLLQKYQNLFTVPTTLPPPRTNDHQISLSEGSNPMNVRPYRYPRFQKTEIEKQIRTMMEQ